MIEKYTLLTGRDCSAGGETNLTIVCIDDEPLILQFTADMCRKLPQKPKVATFHSAESILEYLRRNIAEIAILDINMPDMNGIRLAAKIKEISPETAIIFLTGYTQYAVEAFALHASGYVMKPVSQKRLVEEVDYALSRTSMKQERNPPHIEIRTFGEFDVFVNRKCVHFARARAKELLAYLVDRRGGSISRERAANILWEDVLYDRRKQKELDVIIRSLRKTLKEYGIEHIFEMKGGLMRIYDDKISCDMYRFLAGDIDAINEYRGEYMNGYSWASITEAYITLH